MARRYFLLDPLYAFALSVTLSDQIADINRLTDRMREAHRRIALDRIERAKLLRACVAAGVSKNRLARLIGQSSGQFYKELEWPESVPDDDEPPKRLGAR